MAAFIITVLLLSLLIIGTPVGFALAISGVVGLLMIGDINLVAGILTTAPLSTASAYEFITVPMFLLMAEFVILSGVASGLFSSASTWIGRVPGGLGIATAIAGAGFAAISGSSTAAAATLSATSIPAMLKMKYEPKLACGVVAISGTLAMLIPPSIALVLYGIIADQSIGKLLIAGIVPGVLVAFAICLTVLFLVWRDPSRAPLGQSYTMREKFRSLQGIWPMLVLFMLVTGVIYTGVATPTEAAALGACGAFLILLGSGNASYPLVFGALKRATYTTCMVLLIILGAMLFGYFLTLTRATQEVVSFVGALPVNRWVVMFLICLIYLVLGCFLDQVAILILTIPVVLPVIKALGFDPIWFGVIVIVIAEVGMVTPPVGLNVFVVSKYTGRPVDEVFRGVGPHVIAHVLVIALLCIFPQLILWLPGNVR